MKLITVISIPSKSSGFSIGHVLRCLATVVSLLCVMSKKCPWNCVKRLFLVCPTYWMLQFLQVMTYIRLELWQVAFFILWNLRPLVVETNMPEVFIFGQ